MLTIIAYFRKIWTKDTGGTAKKQVETYPQGDRYGLDIYSWFIIIERNLTCSYTYGQSTLFILEIFFKDCFLKSVIDFFDTEDFGYEALGYTLP